jgi:hypothetical protein
MDAVHCGAIVIAHLRPERSRQDTYPKELMVTTRINKGDQRRECLKNPSSYLHFLD